MMTDYIPLVATEMDIRNLTTPPLDYNDVSKAELLLKIEGVERYVKEVYFASGSIPSKARMAVVLLIISNLLSGSPTLAKKYCTLSSETLGDYHYVLASPTSSGDESLTPYGIIKGWHRMAIDMLERMATPSDFEIRVVNE